MYLCTNCRSWRYPRWLLHTVPAQLHKLSADKQFLLKKVGRPQKLDKSKLKASSGFAIHFFPFHNYCFIPQEILYVSVKDLF